MPLVKISKRKQKKPKTDKRKDARDKFVQQLLLRESDERKRTQQELMQLMQQLNTLIRKEQKVLPAYHRRFKDEDPRSLFYYRMLRRIGLPEVHARFAPSFLKSNQIVFSRWSSVLFARLEQAFYARPEALSTLEVRMRGHQVRYDATKYKNESEERETIAAIQQEDALALEKLELIPQVPVVNAPPGLAPQVRGKLESHEKHTFFTYDGRWKDGEMHGPMGVYAFSDGGKYSGEWKASQQHGSGCAEYPNGVTYSGSFVDGKFHGFGVMEQSGFVYEGEFRNGLRCGMGKLQFTQSDTFYEGEFYDNMQHGKGSETNGLGYSYMGGWRQNRMCEPGRLLCPDKEEDARVERLKKARREKREAQAAAKKAFTEKAQKEEDEEDEEGDDDGSSESEGEEEDESGGDDDDGGNEEEKEGREGDAEPKAVE